MSKQKYVEINGKRFDLDEGTNDAHLGDGYYLVGRVIEKLGLEVKIDATPFEDLEAGIYQVATQGGDGRVFRKGEDDCWTEGRYADDVTDSQLDILMGWHYSGRLHRLRMNEEPTNA